MPHPSSRLGSATDVTREAVLTVAHRLSREHGLQVWPLEALLTELGTSSAVVEDLVGDRSALSAAVVEAALASVARPEAVEWRRWWGTFLTDVQRACLDRPGTASWLLAHGGRTPTIAPLLAEGLAVLGEAGFDEEAAQALGFAVTSTLGVLARGESAGREDDLEYGLARTLDGLDLHLRRRRAHYSDLVIERLTDTDPFALAEESAAELSELTGVPRHDVALILGSGWAAAADQLGEVVATVDAADLPGFRASAVVGHASTIRSISVARDGAEPLRALVLPRSHYYEGHGVRAVAHGVRVAAAAGCRTIVLTNGCGGLDRSTPAGSPVLISDHLNLTGSSPLEGPTFVDLTDLYSADLRALARTVDPTLSEGVYAQFRGPHYETPAEVRMAGILGASLVGMSTGLEAIAARHVGMKVLGFSLVTNLAAGVSDQPLSHEEVLQAGRDAAPRCAELLAGVTRLL